MKFDVLIVGAGPGGCLAARNLARAGLSVGVFEQAREDRLGKTIIAETEKAVYKLVGVEGPLPEEVPYHPDGVKVITNRGVEVINFDSQYPTVPIFLDRFVKRLAGEAKKAGAQIFHEYMAKGPILQGERVTGVTFEQGGQRIDVTARLTIDASGHAAAIVRKLPARMGIGFDEKPGDQIIGDNHWFEIDTDKAREAIKKGVHQDRIAHSNMGFSGAFSLAYCYLDIEKQRSFVYIGHGDGPGAPQMAELKNKLMGKYGFFAESKYGGGGAIRVIHGLHKLVADGFLVMGEAACQVVPLHASGVGSALFAANLATPVIVKALKGSGEFASAEALWPYAYQYQTGRGSIMATYDAVRRITSSLSNDQFMTMLESGLINGDDLMDAAYIRYLAVTPTRAPKKIITIIRHAGFIGKMFTLLKSVLTLRHLYSKYPKKYNPAELKSWAAKVDKVFRPL